MIVRVRNANAALHWIQQPPGEILSLELPQRLSLPLPLRSLPSLSGHRFCCHLRLLLLAYAERRRRHRSQTLGLA